ncbi:MAG: hypothetical protein WC988_00745 [Patescibacteria group bacterium]
MKNNKSILIVFSILILFLLVFVGWKLTSKKPAQDMSSSQNQQTQKPNEENTTSSVNGNVFDLIKLGKILKCTYSMDAEGVSISGISYVSGKNMRGDFENTDPTGSKMQSHMISDGAWVYTWTSASPQGFKMNVSDAESKTPTADTGSSANGQNLDNFKNNLDFKCNPWVEDTSLFQVPSDIKFTDFSESMKNINSGSKDTMCAACDYAQSEEDKAACKKQLGCQ